MGDRGLVVVTGASGFVGKWLVLLLLRGGYRVRGTVRSHAKAEDVRTVALREVGEDDAARLETVETDLLKDDGWADVFAGASAVMHTASVLPAADPQNPDDVIKPAVDGTSRVLRFSRDAGVRRVICTSSIAAIGYGHGQTDGVRTYDETSFTNLDGLTPPWAYGIAKTRAEQTAWAWAKGNGTALTTIHPSTILGPALDRDTSVSLMTISSMLRGLTPALPRWGSSFVDVRDVAAMHVAALEKPRTIGKRYLAAGRYLTLMQIADILRAAYPRKRLPKHEVPDWLIRIVARLSPLVRPIVYDLGHEKHYDGSRGEQLLGRPYIKAEDAVLSAAESLIRLRIVKS